MATDVGAVRLLVSEENGILLNNCSEILIRKAISKFIFMDRKLILNMKENSIQLIKENFLWQNIIYKFFRYFRLIVLNQSFTYKNLNFWIIFVVLFLVVLFF